MKKLAVFGCLGVVVFVGLLMLLFGVGTYNSLVGKSQAVDASWAQVQNVYQRRADLVPNLVATVAGAANFEKSTLTAVTDARASVGRVTIDASKAPSDAGQLEAFDKAQGSLGQALSRLLMVSENYPQLRATEGFQGLQVQLEGTENRISVERGRFNDATRVYNTARQSFPNVLFAGLFGFGPKPYFAASAGAETAPKVNFDFSSPKK